MTNYINYVADYVAAEFRPFIPKNKKKRNFFFLLYCFYFLSYKRECFNANLNFKELHDKMQALIRRENVREVELSLGTYVFDNNRNLINAMRPIMRHKKVMYSLLLEYYIRLLNFLYDLSNYGYLCKESLDLVALDAILKLVNKFNNTNLHIDMSLPIFEREGKSGWRVDFSTPKFEKEDENNINLGEIVSSLEKTFENEKKTNDLFAEITTLKEKYTSVETEYKNKLIELIKVYFDTANINEWTLEHGVSYKDCTCMCVALYRDKDKDTYIFKWCIKWGEFYWYNLKKAPIELLEKLVKLIKNS